PVFTRRTFDWDRTSRSNAMSREPLRVSFGAALAMALLRDGPPRDSLPAPKPVTKLQPVSASQPAGGGCHAQLGTASPRSSEPSEWKEIPFGPDRRVSAVRIKSVYGRIVEDKPRIPWN